MWEVFSLGYAPYPGRTNEQVMELVASGGRLEQPPGCPVPVYVTMTSCWNPCPSGRPDFAHIITQLRRCQQVSPPDNTTLGHLRKLTHELFGL